MQSSIAIQVDTVCYQYPKASFLALEDVQMYLPAGSCTGLIGPNGAGKSTLISVLSGLLQPKTGQVTYPQYPDLKLVEAIKQKVALVPQDFAFYEQLSVMENLGYFAGLTRLPKPAQLSIIEETIQDCQLDDYRTRPAHALSGGNKRKLNLAIALLKQPQVLFLDEPTVGVDPLSRQVILDLIQQLKRDGKTIVYTSHLLQEVQALCDQIYVMKQGRLIHFEPESKKRVLLELIPAASPELLQQLQRYCHSVEANEHQLAFEPKDAAGLNQALILLAQSGGMIESMSYQPSCLTQFYSEIFK